MSAGLFSCIKRARLGALLLCVLVGVFVPLGVVHAGTYAAAMSQCQSDMAYLSSHGQTVMNACFIESPGLIVLNMSAGRHAYSYDGPACGGLQPKTGKVFVDNTSTVTGCDGTCAYALTDGEQLSNATGQSVMIGTWTPVGQQCNTKTPGLAPDAPLPAVPPKVCGGKSCYDTVSNKFCAVDATGKQMCVDGPSARGVGDCAGTPSGAICAGPKPPLPTPPKLTPITDPATEITGSDKFTDKTTAPGGTLPTVTPITVNTYGVGGQQSSPTSSGQGTGDKGPAPASSTGSPGNSASGGGDCTSPPAMSGDQALAMIARQQWLTRCGTSKDDKNGNGQPDWTEVTDGDNAPYAVTDTNPSSVFQEKAVGMDQVDQTSWAGSTCPDIGTAEVFGQQWTAADPALFCAWLAKVRAVVLLFGAIAAATILALGSR